MSFGAQSNMYHCIKNNCLSFKRAALSPILPAVFIVLSSAANLFAASVSLNWNEHLKSDVLGYKVYYGTIPGSYIQPKGSGLNIAGKTTTTVKIPLTDLTGWKTLPPEGATYYFSITAYDATPLESEFSSPIQLFIPSLTTDSDKDGETDIDEIDGIDRINPANVIDKIEQQLVGENTMIFTTMNSVKIYGTATDNKGVAGVTCLNQRTGTNFTASSANLFAAWTATVDLSKDDNTIVCTSKDAFGNIGTDSIILFSDLTFPVLNIDKPASGNFYTSNSGAVSLSGTVSDNHSVDTVNWAITSTDNRFNKSGEMTREIINGTTVLNSPAVKLNKCENGTYCNKVTVSAKDKAGNLSEKTININYEPIFQ